MSTKLELTRENEIKGINENDEIIVKVVLERDDANAEFKIKKQTITVSGREDEVGALDLIKTPAESKGGYLNQMFAGKIKRTDSRRRKQALHNKTLYKK